MKQRILLTGKNGQLGHALQVRLATLSTPYEIVAVDIDECNLADETAIRTLVRDVRPFLIINPAAYTAVDKAETEIELATAINARAPGILGEEAIRIGAWVIHYSTDYVFDGLSSTPYVETDPTHPQSVYGQSKRDGELALQASGVHHLIFRTSWVVGSHGGNFAKTILRLAASKDSLNVVADQYGAPTSAALLAELTAEVIEQHSAELEDDDLDFPYGLYHVAASGETSWCDYARFVVADAQRRGLPLTLQPDAIQAIPTSDYPLPAKRPMSSRLDTTHFRRTFGLDLPPWQHGVQAVLDQIHASTPSSAKATS